jgi:hypothetical protein
MSTTSVMALDAGRPYLQSPLDDIESFFWVFLYAVVRNSAPGSDFDHTLRLAFDKGGRGEGLLQFKTATRSAYRPLTCELNMLVTKFESELLEMRRLWNTDYDSLSVMGWDADAWVLCCHATALKGLCMVLHLVVGFGNETLC